MEMEMMGAMITTLVVGVEEVIISIGASRLDPQEDGGEVVRRHITNLKEAAVPVLEVNGNAAGVLKRVSSNILWFVSSVYINKLFLTGHTRNNCPN